MRIKCIFYGPPLIVQALSSSTVAIIKATVSALEAKGLGAFLAFEGGVEEAGRQLLSCAVRAGFVANSRVHAVGDGAPWIVGQIEEQFGHRNCSPPRGKLTHSGGGGFTTGGESDSREG